jgi:hypothetical protein
LFTASGEIVHPEAPAVIDLRITRAWRLGGEGPLRRWDPAGQRDPSRRDWFELHLDSAADLDRLNGLLSAAMAANA